MAAWRQAIELAIGEEDLAALGAIARSRTQPASRVERARMLLAYREDPSFFKVGRISWGCTIRLSSAVLRGRWPMVRWRRSMIARGPAKSRRSPLRPRHGLRISPAARPRNSVIRTNWGRRDFL